MGTLPTRITMSPFRIPARAAAPVGETSEIMAPVMPSMPMFVIASLARSAPSGGHALNGTLADVDALEDPPVGAAGGGVTAACTGTVVGVACIVTSPNPVDSTAVLLAVTSASFPLGSNLIVTAFVCAFAPPAN